MEAILPGAPWLIAHRSMLGINMPRKMTLNGQDYVLWQNDRGEIFALDNVCPHMQAPLSNGWICQERNTIACPFHALEFDGEGRLCLEGQRDSQPIAQPLKLKVIGDCIWTYGNCEPRSSIPDIVQNIASQYDFIGIAGDRPIRSDFLSTWLINSDFNHQNGTHRELFQIVQNHVTEFAKDGYWYKVKQESTRANNSLGELFGNPVLLTLPKVLRSTVEYFFPSVLILYAETGVGSFAQVVVQYPQQDDQTKIYEIIFGKFKFAGIKPLFRRSLLKAIEIVVEQDTTAIETRYPSQLTKIKLPNEEIVTYATKLYREWQ
jgi:phenylpropionate dioxygenase-like ring-hydroxylating dioxygenase large terminal subunit